MKITSTLKPGDKPATGQLEEINRAAGMPVISDEDCPAYSPEQLAYLCAEARKRNVKQTVGIRLSKKTIERYKALGKGYTGVMAAVLEYSIAHPEILKKAL
ncbi:MAG: BrnA antitoxin family protein [Spirochaetaceae bacterium]|jgi:uncharacterized protein (DUF4415 family)|nr:BrnA antitoxin family protein [Spirochaetaceae bacterium]